MSDNDTPLKFVSQLALKKPEATFFVKVLWLKKEIIYWIDELITQISYQDVD